MVFNAEEIKTWNKSVMEEFRANDGKVAQFGPNAPMMILTTTGSKTGRLHETPLVYLPESGRMYIFGSKAGAPEHPSWFNNLVANPKVSVELGHEKFEARATEVTGAERDRIFNAQAALMPNFAEYAKATTRQIPVIALDRA